MLRLEGQNYDEHILPLDFCTAKRSMNLGQHVREYFVRLNTAIGLYTESVQELLFPQTRLYRSKGYYKPDSCDLKLENSNYSR